MWGEQDSNLRSRRQRIYSPSQLAALVSPLDYQNVKERLKTLSAKGTAKLDPFLFYSNNCNKKMTLFQYC